MNFLLQDFERDKSNYKKIFGPLGSNVRNTALAVGVPTMLTAIGSQIWDGGVNLLPSLSIAAIATIANVKLLKQNRNPSYASYLLDIDNRTKNIPNAASQYMHEFIND